MIPGVVKDKVWGRDHDIFRTMNVEVHYLEIKKGGFCSEHRHRKSNLFHIISGRLRVTVWDDEDGESIIDDTILKPGQITTVAPGFWHKFEALEDTRCIEIYQILIEEDDIDRRTEGGLKA